MTFFYDLNKKLDSIREKPETTHGQLNERDMSRAAKGNEKYGKEGMQALAKAGREGKDLDKVRDKYNKYDESVEEGIGDITKKVGKFAQQAGRAVGGLPGTIARGAKKALDVIAPGDEPLLKKLQKDVGMPQTGKPPMAQSNQVKEKMNPAKAKSFAALAAPKDKITFADKIAGAKKEVDEMLGDVAAEAMRSALKGGQKKLDKNHNGKLDANDFAMLRKGGKQETDEGWDDMLKDVDRRRSEVKAGHKVAGAKGEIEKTATGIRHTRRYDAKTGETDTGDDAPADGEKRGRGRPKGTKAAIGAKGPTGKSKLMNKEASHDESPNIAKAKAILKKAGYTVSKSGEEELEEKAVSKKQQRFMGMVHATQKGEKAPSKEVSKVAKSMGKKDAEDFAATKHKGLPEKKKPEGKKKEKTEEAGGTGTPTASSGFGFGKGIYDSLNRDLEAMIAESMNISMSMNNDSMHGGASKSLTVTATDDDAVKLAALLKMAGLGDQGSEQTIDENSPDWPTNTESSDDALQYSGGLNGPKSTGQTTVPVIASQENRQATYEDDELARLREMAGVAEGKKPDFLDMDKDGNKTEPMKKAVKDKEDKKVEESILDMKRLWTAYKG
jgi:tetrahydromethanopterin S-methyltransferase subunit G